MTNEDPLSGWKDKQNIPNGSIDEQEYSDTGLSRRFTDTGNFKIYNQKLDIKHMLAEPINDLPQRWRISIKADKDVQSFQSDDTEELKQVISTLCEIYVQMKLRSLKTARNCPALAVLPS